MQKLVAFLCASTLLGIAQTSTVRFLPGSTLRARRDADNLPAEEDAQVIVKIKDSVTSLRHADARLKAFIEKIEEGIKSGDLTKSIDQLKTKVAAGEVNFSQITGAFKEDGPTNLQELVKRISDDTHILLDQLHGRLDSLGNYIKDVKHDADDVSAEQHHTKTE